MTPKIQQYVDDIVNSLGENQAITELAVFTRSFLREDKHKSAELDGGAVADIVRERLGYFVKEGKLKILCPPGFTPESAGRAQTYYVRCDYR